MCILQEQILPRAFNLSHTDKVVLVIGDVHSDNPLHPTGIQGAPSKFLPAIVFSKFTQSLFEESCRQFIIRTKDIAL